MPRKAKRRAAGEGTVYQRTDGRWVGELTLEDGNRKYFYAPTQAEALHKLQQAQYELKQGILATGPKQKIGEHLDYWLHQVHKRMIDPNTYYLYQSLLKVHIQPALGQIQLQKLTTRQIQLFYNKKLDEGLGAGSIRNIQKVLHGGLEHARKERLISVNPAKNISIPTEERREPILLTPEQAQQLLAATQGTALEPVVALALTAALRFGEILALHWKDVDFETGMFHIRRTQTRDEHGKVIEGKEAKTESSQRTILLPQFTCEILKAHRVHQLSMQLKAGSAWQHLDLVCCMKQGNPFRPENLRTQFYHLLEKEGLPRVHIHDLRHNAATFLISVGVSPKVVQEILGHRNILTTMDIYAHVLPSMQKEAAEKMNKLFQKPS